MVWTMVMMNNGAVFGGCCNGTVALCDVDSARSTERCWLQPGRSPPALSDDLATHSMSTSHVIGSNVASTVTPSIAIELHGRLLKPLPAQQDCTPPVDDQITIHRPPVLPAASTAKQLLLATTSKTQRSRTPKK
jgi:hypothetical protein